EWGALVVIRADGDGDGSAALPQIYARPEAMRTEIQRRIAENPAALQVAVERRKLWTVYEQMSWRHANGTDDARLNVLGAALLLPAYFEDRAVGLAAMGERKSGSFYSAEDLDLIHTL